jgi:hypothetical protein
MNSRIFSTRVIGTLPLVRSRITVPTKRRHAYE